MLTWNVSQNPVEYEAAIQTMERTVNNILSGKSNETVWLLEHPPLYTAGSSALPEELLAHDALPIFQTGRGGKYTYHGPGQRVAYIMLDLKKRAQLDLKNYIFNLERLIIDTLKEFDVRGERREDKIGVWVNVDGFEKKIASIGIRVRKWVTYHGIAINISPDLKYFDGIIPCGIEQCGVTSLKELGKEVTMQSFDEALQRQFFKIFNLT